MISCISFQRGCMGFIDNKSLAITAIFLVNCVQFNTGLQGTERELAE